MPDVQLIDEWVPPEEYFSDPELISFAEYGDDYPELNPGYPICPEIEELEPKPVTSKFLDAQAIIEQFHFDPKSITAQVIRCCEKYDKAQTREEQYRAADEFYLLRIRGADYLRFALDAMKKSDPQYLRKLMLELLQEDIRQIVFEVLDEIKGRDRR